MTMQAGVCVTHGLITLKDGVDERDFEKRRLQRVWCNSRRQGSLWQSRDMGYDRYQFCESGTGNIRKKLLKALTTTAENSFLPAIHAQERAFVVPIRHYDSNKMMTPGRDEAPARSGRSPQRHQRLR